MHQQDDFGQQGFFDNPADFSNDDFFSNANINDDEDLFSDDNVFEQQEDFSDSSVSNNDSTDVKLGYKTVGIIVASVMIILALLISGLSKIKLVKPEKSQNDYEQTEQVKKSDSKEVSSGFIEVPSSMYIDYSSDILSSKGVVSNMSRYLLDSQVIYCIDIDLTLGATTSVVHYYCGYNTYSQVEIGDVLNVDYQQVSDKCFSVCTISK